ncbi:MAG: RHS repeat protein [Chloroflexi bacterium]|nr:RHS repeat protein [Chloroflexota bacterium]
MENRLTSVTKKGGNDHFAYDASGQRVKTVQPDGRILYTPSPPTKKKCGRSPRPRQLSP